MNKKNFEIKRENIPDKVAFEVIRYYSIIKNQEKDLLETEVLSRIWNYYYSQRRTEILTSMPENATVEFNRIRTLRDGTVIEEDNLYKLYADILFAMIALSPEQKEYKKIMKKFKKSLKGYGIDPGIKLRDFLRKG